MAEKEQVKPLASAPFPSDVNEEELYSSTQFNLHRRNHLKCCGCVTAFLLIPAVVLLVLSLTIFHIHQPELTVNSMIIQHLSQNVNLTQHSSDVNMTIVVDFSVKNPNVGSFKYSDALTRVYHGGTVVGEGRSRSGTVGAKSTVRLNVSVNVSVRRSWAGLMKMVSDSRVGGRVKIMEMIKKSVVGKMNCSMTYDVSTKAFQKERCGQHLLIT